MKDYVHGYSDKEHSRLQDQANTLTELLHADTHYGAGSLVLEAGCGVGAQTIILAQNSPKAKIISVDISHKSLEKAEKTIKEHNFSNVKFQQADIFSLPFEAESFDHVFVCFVLEHLPNPIQALESLKKVLKKGGSITVIEGDHGSFFCHPQSKEAFAAVQCLIDIQASAKGNSLIGREIFPLLKKAGFSNIKVSPRMVYADSSKPELMDGFIRKTFTAMVEGVKEQALALKLIDEKDWKKGIADLYSTASEYGTFCYTFFKGIAYKNETI